MGWITMTVRKQSLIEQSNNLNTKILQLGQEMRQLDRFATAAANGTISVDELAGISGNLIGDAMYFMQDSQAYSEFTAGNKLALYQSGINTIDSLKGNTAAYQNQYGQVDEGLLFLHCVEEARKEYVANEFTPLLNEKQKELEELKAKYETQLKAVDAELDTLDDSISNQISKNAIKLN